VSTLQAKNELFLSVVIPIFNEEGNIPLLCERLLDVLRSNFSRFEVIAVNDGSQDGSVCELKEESDRHNELKVINLRRNYGQTAALMAGIDHASFPIIVTMDADLQNDPEDIPQLVAKLHEGYDVVSGWRRDRKDAAVFRNLTSRLANRLISLISGVRLNDYGCTLKAYRRDVLQGMRLYGEMHRFVPIYASWQGARVTELPVDHHPRTRGKSKYGIERTLKVLLDLTVVKFLASYATKPIYVFGGFGLVSLFMSFLTFVWMIYYKVMPEPVHRDFVETPLPLVVVMLMLVGCLSMLLGLVAELTVRTYYESQGKRTYVLWRDEDAR